jgi:uncharacterized protein
MAIESFSLRVVTLTATVVNGAVAHGFSSITAPLALLFRSNTVLNPALVIVEVALNVYVLFPNRRERTRALPQAVPRVAIGVPVGALLVRFWPPRCFAASV